MSGAVDGSCDLIASARNHVMQGVIKAYGVATVNGERSKLLPDAPTSKEGGLPDFKIESWLGLYAPKGLPAPVLARLREAVAKALEDAEVQKKFLDIGGVVPPAADRGADRMLEIVKGDVTRWAEVVKKSGGIEPPKEEPKK